ncbi:MAG: hypothetical protein JWM98_628, partial [Thermoleophilia bacterium]|nr:hypothetical protein [Thermoleophilia bacterium]
MDLRPHLRARPLRALAWASGGAFVAAVLLSTGLATGASSAVVVSMTVPSATQIDGSGCTTDTPGITAFGVVQPGTSALSSADCVVQFGSSNDTSMLRLYQSDLAGTAMAKEGFAAQASSTGGSINDIFPVSSSDAWLAANTNVVRHTVNGGATWSAPAGALAGPATNLQDIEVTPDGAIWIAADLDSAGVNRGRAIRSVDGGATWTELTAFLGANLGENANAVAAVDASTAWVVGDNGLIRKTTNGGGSAWTAQTCGAAVNLYEVTARSASWAIAVGTSGRICRTTDGTNWTVQPSGTVQQLRGISMADANVGWVVGHNDTILKTTDGGATWVSQNTTTGEQYKDVHAVSATSAWATGTNGVVVRTVNGGTTWTVVTPVTTTNTYYAMGGIQDSVWIGGSLGSLQHSPTNPLADYDDAGNVDWGTVGAAGAFGACLSSVTGDAATGVDT